MEGVLESTVREGEESMKKVPEITLRCLLRALYSGRADSRAARLSGATLDLSGR